MKLEAGKYYKTRDGRKAYVTGILPFQIEKIYRANGLVTISGGEWAALAWTEWGHAGGNSNDHLDLVSEWTEPVKCGPDIVYLLKYECKCSRNCSMSGHEFFASKEMADYFIRQKEDQYESVEYTLQAYRRSND